MGTSDHQNCNWIVVLRESKLKQKMKWEPGKLKKCASYNQFECIKLALIIDSNYWSEIDSKLKIFSHNKK